MFYERLYEALEILVDFFHADQKGLPLESLKSGETNILESLSYLHVIIFIIYYNSFLFVISELRMSCYVKYALRVSHLSNLSGNCQPFNQPETLR